MSLVSRVVDEMEAAAAPLRSVLPMLDTTLPQCPDSLSWEIDERFRKWAAVVHKAVMAMCDEGLADIAPFLQEKERRHSTHLKASEAFAIAQQRLHKHEAHPPLNTADHDGGRIAKHRSAAWERQMQEWKTEGDALTEAIVMRHEQACTTAELARALQPQDVVDTAVLSRVAEKAEAAFAKARALLSAAFVAAEKADNAKALSARLQSLAGDDPDLLLAAKETPAKAPPEEKKREEKMRRTMRTKPARAPHFIAPEPVDVIGRTERKMQRYAMDPRLRKKATTNAMLDMEIDGETFSVFINAKDLKELVLPQQEEIDKHLGWLKASMSDIKRQLDAEDPRTYLTCVSNAASIFHALYQNIQKDMPRDVRQQCIAYLTEKLPMTLRALPSRCTVNAARQMLFTAIHPSLYPDAAGAHFRKDGRRLVDDLKMEMAVTIPQPMDIEQLPALLPVFTQLTALHAETEQFRTGVAAAVTLCNGDAQSQKEKTAATVNLHIAKTKQIAVNFMRTFRGDPRLLLPAMHTHLQLLQKEMHRDPCRLTRMQKEIFIRTVAERCVHLIETRPITSSSIIIVQPQWGM